MPSPQNTLSLCINQLIWSFQGRAVAGLFVGQIHGASSIFSGDECNGDSSRGNGTAGEGGSRANSRKPRSCMASRTVSAQPLLAPLLPRTM